MHFFPTRYFVQVTNSPILEWLTQISVVTMKFNPRKHSYNVLVNVCPQQLCFLWSVLQWYTNNLQPLKWLYRKVDINPWANNFCVANCELSIKLLNWQMIIDQQMHLTNKFLVINMVTVCKRTWFNYSVSLLILNCHWIDCMQSIHCYSLFIAACSERIFGCFIAHHITQKKTQNIDESKSFAFYVGHTTERWFSEVNPHPWRHLYMNYHIGVYESFQIGFSDCIWFWLIQWTNNHIIKISNKI